MTGEPVRAAGGGTNEPKYDPLPLARALLDDPFAPPRALIAAWKCVYLDQPDELVALAFAAAARAALSSGETANQPERRQA